MLKFKLSQLRELFFINNALQMCIAFLNIYAIMFRTYIHKKKKKCPNSYTHMHVHDTHRHIHSVPSCASSSYVENYVVLRYHIIFI